MTVGSGPLQGRVAVVTGGTSGIGLEIVQGLAVRGAHTVLVGRGTQRVEAVASRVRSITGNPEVEGVAVDDLRLRASWSTLSTELHRRLPLLHILVNNAGALFTRRATTADGFEQTFALNVLAPLALTAFLQDRLRGSAPARVVNVASAAHLGHSVNLSDLQSTRSYHGFRTYGESKLELILLSRELATRFAGTGVTVNSVHPGFVRSGFGRNNRGGSGAVIAALAFLFGKSARSGAKTPLRVAADPDLEHLSGEYFSSGHVAASSAAARDADMASKLYALCLPMTGAPDVPLPEQLRRAR
jgi:NAD(P)-dependent dehydrogenase (short-subunit alcohol dehydrogenase family)